MYTKCVNKKVYLIYMNMEKRGGESLEDRIRDRLAQIQERATNLRLRAESSLVRLREIPNVELNQQQRIE